MAIRLVRLTVQFDNGEPIASVVSEQVAYELVNVVSNRLEYDEDPLDDRIRLTLTDASEGQ